jgi:hypothetical protein
MKIYGWRKRINLIIQRLDRYGMMRPTKDILINGEKMSNEKWKTQEKWLHWDMNPWCVGSKEENFEVQHFQFPSENNSNYKEDTKLQGFLTFSDATDKDGGFLCIPGFHKNLEKWTKMNTSKNKTHFIGVPVDDPMVQFAQRIPVRSGCLVIWNSKLPHCNFPNDSCNFRLNQYVFFCFFSRVRFECFLQESMHRRNTWK